MKLSRAQQETLTHTAAAPFGEVSRWDVDASRLRTIRVLVRDGYMTGLDGGWYRITNKGRAALEESTR